MIKLQNPGSKHTTVHKIYVPFAPTMLMTRTKKPEIKEYSSTRALLEPQFLHDGQNMHTYILRSLHFSQNAPTQGNKLCEVRFMTDHLRTVLIQKMIQLQNLCTNDSLLSEEG
jgi:hypothetical protein